ncbi:vitelline membrane outer layer protein 1-like [Corapipo altera]|uniref:vitelline membrane outer layer protein 1-like n=1 Tax=Corapipo altera TaxID=415028 RepID=UPI000FD6AB96|nr:vitelline membrane outer layer protein 1-like [Corapipo altera]
MSFQLRVEAPRGLWDDTAANDLTMRCSGGAVRDSRTLIYRGSWGGWSEPCPPPMGICGLRTRVDPSQDDIDDTGLNNVEFVCCEP